MTLKTSIALWWQIGPPREHITEINKKPDYGYIGRGFVPGGSVLKFR
jgi:hypothetical protein